MIIAISGKIGSGKSYICNHIIKSLPEYNFKRKTFAYNVRKTVSILTDIDMEILLSREAKNIYLDDWGMYIGEMFQKIATSIKKDIRDDVWLISLLLKYNDDENWLIDDLRYLNECVAIKKKKGILIRLEGDPKNIRGKDKRDPNHVSETELDNYDGFDIIYYNELSSNIDELLINILAKIQNNS